MDIWPFTSVYKLGILKSQIFWTLLDPGSELKMIQKTQCHCGAPVRVGAYGGQVIDWPFAQIHHIVSRMGP